jgi:hypothetical protein
MLELVRFRPNNGMLSIADDDNNIGVMDGDLYLAGSRIESLAGYRVPKHVYVPRVQEFSKKLLKRIHDLEDKSAHS